MKALLEKCVVSKPSVKDLATQLFIYYFTKGMKEEVFAKLNAAITENLNVPKFVVPAYDVIRALLEKFGPQKMDMLKPFIPATIKACGSSKPQTKDAAVAFLKECLNWIGQAFMSLIDGLNKVQIKTLDDYLKETPCPNKALKKGGGVATITPGAPAAGGDEAEATADFSAMDAYELATAVDIFKTYNEAYFEAIFALPKWNEKKAKIDEFLEKAKKTPKFVNTNISWISNIVKKLFMDPNAVVTKSTFLLLAACAKGLRKNFSSIAKKEVGGLLLKFKDKKMTNDIMEMLAAFDYCLKPSDVIEDIKVALKEKQLDIKNNVIIWLCKVMRSDAEETEKLADKLIQTFIEMTEEGDKTVRENVSKFIALVLLHCGVDKYSKQIGKIKPEKMATINKALAEFEKETPTNAKGGAKADPGSPKKAANSKTPTAKDEAATPTASVKGGAAGGLAGAKAAAKNKATEEAVDDTPAKKAGGKGIVASQNESARLPEPNMTFEEVEIKLKDMEFDPAIIDKLANVGWEKKLEGLNKALAWLADNPGFSEEIMILLRHSTKQFDFSNPKFNKELLQGLMSISEDMDCKKKLFNEPNVRLMVELCVERLSDKNFLNAIQDLLIRAFSMVDPKSIISTLIDLFKKKTPNPKICETLSELLDKILVILTATYCPVSDLIEFAKYTFENPNATVKKVGNTIICKLYASIGPKIKDYLNDINQNIMKTLDADMKKVTPNLKATPTIEIFGVKGGVKTDPNAIAPTADVSASLNALIPNLEHANFQTRKDALESVMSLLSDASFNIKPNNLDGFMNTMVKRVEDSHKTVLKLAIEVAGVLAKSLGKNFKPWVKIILPVIVKNLQDKQSAVRDETMAAINKIYENVENEREAVIREMMNTLTHDSVESKQEALNFLNSHAEDLQKLDYKNCVDIVLKGLESKSKPIREGFEVLLKNSVDAKGEDMFMKAAKSLNPASSKIAIGLLDKFAGRQSTVDAGGNAGDKTSRAIAKTPPRSRDASNAPKRDGIHQTPAKDHGHPGMGERSKSTNVLGVTQAATARGSDRHIDIPNAISHATVVLESKNDPRLAPENAGKLIFTSYQRKNRIAAGAWGFDGPTDKNLVDFYTQLNRHFHPTLLKGMFSVELEVFQPAISDLNDILQTQPEVFLDVQDLVLQWVFARSFEARPHLTTFFIQFLTELLKKYAGANFLADAEKNLILCSAIQLYVTCNRYVDPSYFTMLFQLVINQTGGIMFLSMVDWNIKENKIIEDFHMDHMLDIIQVIAGSIHATEVPKTQSICQTMIGLCYARKNKQTTMKCIQILTNFYTKNKDFMQRLFKGPNDEVLVAIHHLAEQGGDLHKGSYNNGMLIKNEIIEEPGRSQNPSDEGDNNSEGQDQDVDYEFLELKGQMDSFLNNFLRADDAMAFKYLQLVKDWIQEPRMESLLQSNINDILTSLIKYFQKLYSKFDPVKMKYYVLMLENLELLCGKEEMVKNLQETVTFELFDTLLFILIATNENRMKYSENSKEYQSLTKMTGTLNGIILKIISHGDGNQICQVLFDLLIKCRSEYVPEKFDGLVVKCIVKITQRIEENVEEIEIDRLFEKMHYYMVLMKNLKEDKKDDTGVKVIKTVLNELVKKFDERKVMQGYQAIQGKEAEDSSIKKWLHMIIQTKRSASTDNVSKTPVEHPRTEVAAKRNAASAREPHMEHASSMSNMRKGADPEPEMDAEEDHQAHDEVSETISSIIDKLRQKGLAVAMIPKIIKELTTYLRTLDGEIDIEPFLDGVEEKYRTYVIKEIKNLYNNIRNGNIEASETKSRASYSNYQSLKNSTQIEDEVGPDGRTPNQLQRSTLRPTASATNIANKQANFASQSAIVGGQYATPNSTVRSVKQMPKPGISKQMEELDEQQRKMEEMKRRIGIGQK